MRRHPKDPDGDEKYNLDIALSNDDQVVRKIPCKVWLPKRIGERPVLRLYPKKRWDRLIAGLRPPFGLKGRIIGDDPGDVTTISARKVWTPTARTRHHGKSRSETTVEADVYDLQILQRRSRVKKRRRVPRSTQYWLTACPALDVGPWLTKSYTGEVTIDRTADFEITLGSGAQLKLEKIYRYEDRDEGTLRYAELIARHDNEVAARDFSLVDDALLGEIDDFLAIVSFASRYRSACVGFDAFTDRLDHFQFFRGHITAPEQREWDLDEAVIDLAHFSEFVRTAYTNFVATGPHPLIRHALHLVVPREGRTMESSFTALYAALETIVLWYREKKGLVYIIEEEHDWKRFSDDVRKYVKKHELVQGKDPTQKSKRAMLSAKVNELRRVPFRTAADSLCQEYSITLDDLWPLHGRLPDVSLTEIRNRIVHGGTFDRPQYRALIGAGEHMRWTVERVLLGVLKWPVKKSKVSNAFLQNFTLMTELAADREALKEPNVANEVAAASEA